MLQESGCSCEEGVLQDGCRTREEGMLQEGCRTCEEGVLQDGRCSGKESLLLQEGCCQEDDEGQEIRDCRMRVLDRQGVGFSNLTPFSLHPYPAFLN
jgi:hypothetical protein